MIGNYFNLIIFYLQIGFRSEEGGKSNFALRGLINFDKSLYCLVKEGNSISFTNKQLLFIPKSFFIIEK